ncbi:MAG: polysaccharide deacetylase family protein [Ruminococcus sp.]|nr:polysaccharide deacetylase family protein [Ruminococcus sp.]
MTAKKNPPLAALTFDDGPNCSATEQILDILGKYHVTASFFLVGDNITPETAPTVRRAFEMGCEINNHSRTHSNMTELSREDIISEIEFTDSRIEEITGKKAAFFRPPYIAVNELMYSCIEKPFICGAGCNDWDDSVSVDERFDRTMEQLTDGVIILLHDSLGNGKTVQAVERLIPAILEKGYTFVTVSGLFAAKGVPVKSDDNGLYTVVGGK